MKTSVLVSAGCHVAVLGFALWGIGASEALKMPPVDAIEVDISQISAVSKRQAVTTEDAPVSEKTAPKKTETLKKVPPAPKVADEVNTASKQPTAPEKEIEKKAEPKKEEPKKEEPKKVEEKPLDSDPLKKILEQQEQDEKKKKAEDKKKLEDKKKAEEKKLAAEKQKKELKLDDIAAFLNKKEGERTAPQKSDDKEGSPKKGEKAMAGADDAIGATIIEAVTSKIQTQCFTVPPAARDANIAVPVRFKLSRDGMVLSVDADTSSDPIFSATASAAISAVRQCEPYDLPHDKYDVWKDGFEIDFNPNMMNRT
jgi:membrane protein involved in colicin uptake